VFGVWERVVLWLVTLGTAGIAYALCYPFISFEHYRSAIEKMRIGNKRLRFTGELWEYYKVCIGNLFLNVITLGLYFILGYGDLRIARYVDSHIELLEDKEDYSVPNTP
jgi:uncharacterized membrane protein YjgN (DUF898 family)